MRCSEVQNRIPEYEADALARVEQQAVGTHLAGCPACRRELDGLGRALRALDSVGNAPAPDLWASFQQRLAAEDGACEKVGALLPGFAAGELDASDREWVENHLPHCRSCEREAAVYSRSLGAVRKASRTPAPDLWAAYGQRLGTEISCRDARGEMLAFLDGDVSGPREWALASHLETCAECAAEAASYRRAESVLGRVARNLPVVDLWPQFQLRLQAEQERAAVPVWRRWLEPVWAALAGFGRLPAVRPALAFGAAAAVVWFAAAHLPGPSAPNGGVQAHAVTPPQPVRAHSPAPVVKPQPRMALRPDTDPAVPAPVVRAPRIHRRVRIRRHEEAPAVTPATKRLVVASNSHQPIPTPVQPDIRKEERWGGLQVAFNPDIIAPQTAPEPEAPAAGSSSPMSGDTERAVKKDFVQFAQVISEIRDVASAPLGSGSDDR